ncbi:tigger transposable element-derived 4 [Brachionus plicatilis]|uniref:Tigger transposable element-derived 4 n=1 Tax=Brachionus plicatilis TaxID=10195 RepID=A0A3M7PEF5_BRAPC|nr:tigger transposable element-derived 4 [Brachionus plicatilis]
MESKKRKSPEISLKLEIIEDYNNKATPTELSRKYGLAASTISTIFKNQEAIKKASESMRDIKKAKRLREPEYKELEKNMDMWFRDTKTHNSITLDGPLIQAQALKIATVLQKPDFKASSGWLNNLLKRHNCRKSQSRSFVVARVHCKGVASNFFRSILNYVVCLFKHILKKNHSTGPDDAGLDTKFMSNS